jgi:hypothetical protein
MRTATSYLLWLTRQTYVDGEDRTVTACSDTAQYLSIRHSM